MNEIIRFALNADGKRTDVLLGVGALATMKDLLSEYWAGRVILISDEYVAPLYAHPLSDSLNQSGYEVHLLTVSPGEETKTLDTLSALYTKCHALGVAREDVIVAVGGGMVGDLAGMLAGTYLRGLTFVQIPTSLLAMVTASVGGKVGVNYRGYKNLVGMFYPPALIVADTATLKTLPEIEIRSGLGELVAVGVLGATEIFVSLEENGATRLDRAIVDAIHCKGEIVAADPFDQLGIRAKLNLGHTFGHALETLSGFGLAHGIAVGVGLHIATLLAARLGLCEQSLVKRVRHLLESLQLPAVLDGYSPKEIIAAMRHDKKCGKGLIRFVLPEDLGRVILVSEKDIPPDMLVQVLKEIVGGGGCVGQ
jgi:3-dehydroquinate synthase